MHFHAKAGPHEPWRKIQTHFTCQPLGNDGPLRRKTDKRARPRARMRTHAPTHTDRETDRDRDTNTETETNSHTQDWLSKHPAPHSILYLRFYFSTEGTQCCAASLFKFSTAILWPSRAVIPAFSSCSRFSRSSGPPTNTQRVGIIFGGIGICSYPDCRSRDLRGKVAQHDASSEHRPDWSGPPGVGGSASMRS